MPIEEEAPSATASLGQRLRTARLAHRMTQSDVANGEFSVSYISAVERNQLRPSLHALERLAQRLHAPLADLLSVESASDAPAPPSRVHAEPARLHEELEQDVWQALLLARQEKSEEALALLARLRSHDAALAPNERGLWHWHYAHIYLLLGLPDEARNEIQQAEAHAERDNDVELRIWLRYGLGRVHQLKHQWPLAFELYQACLATITDHALVAPTLRLKVLSGLSDACWQLGEHGMASDYLTQIGEGVRDFLDAEQLASVYSSISTTYSDHGDVWRACEYAIRGIAASDQAAAQRLALRTYNRQGQLHLQARRFDAAHTSLGTAREMAERWHDATSRVEALCGLAAVYLGQERFDEAAAMVEQARDVASMLGNSTQQAEVLLVEAHLLEARGEPAAACHDFERAVTMLEQGAPTPRLRQAYKDYSDLVERQGDSVRAYELLKKAWELRDATPAGA